MPRISKPHQGEPIRLVETSDGPRYVATIDTAPRDPVTRRRIGGRKQVQRRFPTLTAARAWVSATRSEVDAGNYTEPSKVTFQQLAQDWLASKRDVREVTVSGYADALRDALVVLGDRPAQTITRRDVDALVTRWQTTGGRTGEGYSHRSIAYMLLAVRQTLAYGVSCGVLRSNPASDVKPPRKVTQRPEQAILEPAQVRHLIGHVDSEGEVWESVAVRLVACGMRRSEVLGLAWDAVDLDAGTVTVEASRTKTGRGSATARHETKNRRPRMIPVEQVHPGTVAALRRLRAAQAAARLSAGSAWTDSGLVVVDNLGAGVHPAALSWRWAALVKSAGLGKVGMHSLRHSLATMMNRAGIPPVDAAALLGHSTQVYLDTYVTQTDQGAATAASRLGEVFAAGQM